MDSLKHERLRQVLLLSGDVAEYPSVMENSWERAEAAGAGLQAHSRNAQLLT